jgi:hypothetical protein
MPGPRRFRSLESHAAGLLNPCGFALRQQPGRQDCAHQFVLRRPLSLRCGLQIFVGHAQIAVAQIVADGELVFAHPGQHASDRVPKGMPAHSVDAKLGECGLDLAVEYRREIQRLSSARLTYEQLPAATAATRSYRVYL